MRKTLTLLALCLCANSAIAQSTPNPSSEIFKTLHDEDVLTYDSHIVSKEGGKYISEIAIVATYNGIVVAKETIASSQYQQEILSEESHFSMAKSSVSFPVRTLRKTIETVRERVEHYREHILIEVLFLQKFTTDSVTRELAEHPEFVALDELELQIKRLSSRNSRDSVWTLHTSSHRNLDVDPNWTERLLNYDFRVSRLRMSWQN